MLIKITAELVAALPETTVKQLLQLCLQESRETKIFYFPDTPEVRKLLNLPLST